MIFLILISSYIAYANAGGLAISSPYALNYNAHAIATPFYHHHAKPTFFASPYASIRSAAAAAIVPSPYYRHALPSYKIRSTPIILPPTTSYHATDFSHSFPSTYTIPSSSIAPTLPLPLSLSAANHHYPSFYSSVPFSHHKHNHHHHEHHHDHHDFDDTITVGGYSINPYSSYPFYYR